MCRWLAYNGPPLYLEALILNPDNSLIDQSRSALESVSTTNGDGFGIGWYDSRPEPGQFRDILPAWNDSNLRSMSAQIRSPLFFAHVRASTGTPTSRTNSHPFKHGRWMFMHNGKISAFGRIRRDLSLLIAPELFPFLQGTTDSETFFFLLLTNGLEDDVTGAFQASVAQVLDAMRSAGIDEAFSMTAAVSDGQVIHALRYASNDDAPSLYYGLGVDIRDSDGKALDTGGNSILILSEPLDKETEHWIAVPQSHLITAGDGAVDLRPFTLAA
jgi:predicted glutamine amidotransferase